ncbi:carbohydrate ABC transporter permease [Alkaliphilus peptidifermentans]|uniref:Carbohydrate ABC transporter membrane protein 1, CUT1 family n=1 Tax=Alkaliphilus peptidifermentans DSM 18978 TaxID=1120976 RepID=A0A1G5JPF8_9FIRM|nr:sugar ABC transporter permease [Alkaliphilus peptidifermentans]SCY89598.1 carbohydrate ABC transporter membrane protein 1, CUT1 family [Alkaliphilus peptidifermentans DSM 18978]
MRVLNIIKKYKLEIIFIAPLTLYIFYFTLLPILETIRLSFIDRNTSEITLANYSYLLGKSHFRQAFFNTIGITLLGLSMQMTVGLILALILKKNFKGKGIFRSIILTPMGVPTLVSGVALLYIFDTHGFFNELIYRIVEGLKYIGIMSEAYRFIPIDWGGGGFRTLFIIAFGDMWKVTPIVTLLLLAGLEAIPRDVYEATEIDGATTWQTFRYVTIPLLKPAFTMAVILRAVDAFRIFELPMILAGRGTPVLATYAFEEFRVYNNPNVSGAASTILLILIIIFVFLYLKYVDKGEGLT